MSSQYLTEKSDYSPISILLVLTQAFENVIFEPMKLPVTILFRRLSLLTAHSTMHALVRVSDDINLNLELNQPTFLVLLDFSKGFDSVCHMECPFLNCVNVLAFISRRRRLFHLIFLFGIKGSVVNLR
jgi:hypothetical protein